MPTTIESVCKAHPGAHYCLFYNSEEHLVDLLAEYFKHGIENGEYCVWVTAHDDVESKARKALTDAMPYFDESSIKGQVEFLKAINLYLKGGYFHSERVFNNWFNKLNSSLERHYSGMRVTGDLGWHGETDWLNLMNYEAHLNESIPETKFAAICTYPLDTLNASQLIDVVNRHQVAVARNNGKWHIIESRGTEKGIDILGNIFTNPGAAVIEDDIFTLPLLYPDKCDGCGLCISVCKNGLLYLENERIAIKTTGTCDWCADCETVCATGAISCLFEIIQPD
jgi:ferredoxin